MDAKNPSPTPTISSYPILNSMKPLVFYCPRLRGTEAGVEIVNAEGWILAFL
jgi:hypothetical protein